MAMLQQRTRSSCFWWKKSPTGRSSRKPKGRQWHTKESTRLAWRSVRCYITALTDLYHTQKALGTNAYPLPREDNVQEYLVTLQRRDTQRDKANYVDNGRDTLLDCNTE